MSTAASAPSRATETVSALARFFSSYRFPTTALFVIFLYNLALLVSIAIPASSGPLGQFAEEMRVWCFGYDPATGSYQWTYVLMVTVEPIVMGGLLVTVWYQPLKQAVTKTPRAMLPYAGVALLLVSTAAASLFGMRRQPKLLGARVPRSRAPHRARAAYLPPHRSHRRRDCLDRAARPRRAADRRLRVVRRDLPDDPRPGEARRGLAARGSAGVRHRGRRDDDFRARRRPAARGDGCGAERPRAPVPPRDRAAGDVAEALDRLGVVRRKDPTTGIIDHANVLALVDRSGKLAYRFSLGDLQERWLADALRLLVSEPRVPGAT